MPEITNQEYRSILKEIVERSKEMYQNREYRDPGYGELCMAVVRLIEASNYGREEAESELVLESKNPYAEIMDDSFDGIAMQFMKLAHDSLGRFGEISMVPYSQGLHTKSAKVRFKPRE